MANSLLTLLSNTRLYAIDDKKELLQEIRNAIVDSKFIIVDEDTDKPWGAFFRIASRQAEEFIKDFFPGLDIDQARLGMPDAELSPKILIVLPGQRLSWQYHNRRAERWRFISEGGYRKSMNNEQGEHHTALAGQVIQFQKGERHRLESSSVKVTVVAEIWQHSDPTLPSDEKDIVRLDDDYAR